MTVDTASLELRVRSLEVEVADKRLQGLEKSAKKGEKATDDLVGSFKRAAGPILALVASTKTLMDAIGAQRRYDQLSSTLTTVTGSAQDAAEVFKILQRYANITPFAIENLNEAFIKLVNYGLDPSERALTSYGNTATSLGKDITDMVQAVAAATTGEFDSLKSFGIRAKNQGDTIAFSFRGTTKVVKNSTEEIEKYLLSIGEVDFAGAMENSLGKLNDTMLALDEQWDTLLLNVMQAGVGNAIQEGVQVGVDALVELNAQVASGELEASLRASAGRWAGWGNDAQVSVDAVTGFLTDQSKTWGPLVTKNVDNMISTFRNFPENVRAFIQIATTEVAAGMDKAKSYVMTFGRGVKEFFSGGSWGDAVGGLEKELAGIDEARMGSIEYILKERDTALASYEAQMEASRKLREQYDKDQETDYGDRLAKYRIKQQEQEAQALSKSEQAKLNKQKKEFEDLVKSLQTEEESIQKSYEKRRAIIEKNTSAESEARTKLMDRLDKQHEKELRQLQGIEEAYERRKRLIGEVQAIQESMWTKSQQAAAAYQAQMETLWQAQMAGSINEQEHAQMVEQTTKEYEKQQAKMEGTYFDLEEISKSAARNAQSAFADFLFDPFAESADGMLLGFIKVLQRMAAEAAAAQIFQSMASSSGGWLSTLASVGSSIAGAWGGGAASGMGAAGKASMAAGASQAGYSNLGSWVPGRAVGGPTEGGRLYEVNERGPEMYSEGGRDYLMGSKGGVVRPLSPGGSGSEVNVNFDIQINVTPSGTETSVSSSTSDMNELGKKIKDLSAQVIQEEMKPGGLLWNAKENRNG